MRVRADGRRNLPDTDLMLDVTLWIEIALLAYVIRHLEHASSGLSAALPYTASRQAFSR